jgi:hypothetical protein
VSEALSSEGVSPPLQARSDGRSNQGTRARAAVEQRSIGEWRDAANPIDGIGPLSAVYIDCLIVPDLAWNYLTADGLNVFGWGTPIFLYPISILLGITIKHGSTVDADLSVRALLIITEGRPIAVNSEIIETFLITP